jgi:hypothetical protein
VLENNDVMLAELRNKALPQKDVKNEGWSQWLIENKGSKKVVPMVD